MSDEASAFYRSKAVLFLRGALECAAASSDMSEIRCAYQALTIGDDHLEIAAGQLTLNFGKDGK